MVTPHLEKLILCGKAFFKTFVAGGDKHTLTFGNDRFIIITDITYFPMNVNSLSNQTNENTQIAIYGERGYNNFIFRNFNVSNNDPDLPTKDFCSPVTINTFILHDKQVGFSFCNAPLFQSLANGVASTINPGYAPPLEFGIDGQPGAVVVINEMDTPGVSIVKQNLTTRPISGVLESTQLFFPFEQSNRFGTNINNNKAYPLLHVNYVEVLGQSNNISI